MTKEERAQIRKAYYHKNPEPAKTYGRRYRAERPEVKAACIERIKKWRSENPELAKRATKNNWAKHPERQRVYTANRRAKVRRDGGRLSVSLAEQLLHEQHGKCNYCKRELSETGYHLDHIMPIALGGRHIDENIQLICPGCNARKGAKHPDVFKAEMEAAA